MTTDRKLRWGIIGPGGIAQAFRDGVKHSKTGELVAIATRNPKKPGLGATFPGARNRESRPSSSTARPAES